MAEPAKPKPYISPEEQKLSQMRKVSYWYVAHKVLLRKILIGILIGFSTVTLGYGLWGFFDYLVLDYGNRKAMFEELVNSRVLTQEWIQSHAPQPIDMDKTYIFSSGDDYDFLVKIENKSPYYWAEFDYKFTYSGGETETQKGFILPLEQKWVGFLAFESESRPSSARLEIEQLSWNRVDTREVPDYELWKAEHMNIKITDVEYISDVILDSERFSKTKFTAQNLCAYGYWQIGFYIIAYRGATPAGVNYVKLDRFRSGALETVEVSWFDTLSGVSKIEVEPEVNLFDDDIYMPV